MSDLIESCVTLESYSYVGLDDSMLAMLDIINTLRDGVLENKFKSGDALRHLYNKEVVEWERLIKERFGINTHIIGDDESTFAFVLVPPHKVSNTITTNSNAIYDDVMEWSRETDKHDLTKENFKKGDDDILIDTDDLDDNTIYRISYQEMQKLHNDYADGKIKVDYKNIYVEGVSSTFVMGVDIVGLINTYNVTSKEILAFMVHEMGHAITHVTASNQRLISTFALMDSLVDFKSGKVKVGNHVKTVDDFININNELQRMVIGYKKETAVIFNSERAADMIATQFGLGEDLTTGLMKIGNDTFRTRDVVVQYITFLASLILLSIAIATGDIFLILSIFTTTFTMFISSLSPSMQFQIPHGDGYERLKAIRSQMIKNIRKEENKQIKADLTKQIKSIDFIEGKLKELAVSRSGINYITDLLLGQTDYIGMVDLNKRMTSIVENKLHVHKHVLRNKFKQHSKG